MLTPLANEHGDIARRIGQGDHQNATQHIADIDTEWQTGASRRNTLALICIRSMRSARDATGANCIG